MKITGNYEAAFLIVSDYDGSFIKLVKYKLPFLIF
jgi:hypothetical protein